MTKITQTLTTLLTCALICLALLSCGKKESISKPPLLPYTPPVEAETEAYLKKQVITCEDNQTCPNYIAKVVVTDGPGKFKTCTGFLINPDVLVTSTSCLPEYLRLADLNCSKDVFFLFYRPGTTGERIGCSKVLQVSDLTSDNPVLWRDDVAFLEINKSLNNRRSQTLSREGMTNNMDLYFWGIEQASDDRTGFIRQVDCNSIHSNYINPLVTNEYSPNMLIEGCAFKNGFSGAPLIDSKRRVRGMISQGMDPELRAKIISSNLLLRPLKEILHATNFACAPIIYDTDTGANERECSKDLSELLVERARSEMLNPANLFTGLKNKLESGIDVTNKFIRYSVKLIPKNGGDLQETEITPKCFKDIKQMGNGSSQDVYFSMPKVSFRRAMDAHGRILGAELDNGTQATGYNFSPKRLRNSGVSDIFLYINNSYVTTYFNIPACPSLL